MMRLFVLLAGCCALSACAASVSPPTDADPDLDEARRVVENMKASRPAQPAFSDPVSLDSPNAVGRYVAISRLLDARDRQAAGAARLTTERFEVTDPEIAGI